MRHIVHGTRLVRGSLNAQGIGILVQGIYHALRERLNGFAVFKSALDDFVVNVGDVSNISHLQTTDLEPSLHHVKRHHGTRVAEVAQVVHRHAADVHAHLARLNGNECFQLTRERVENSQGHGVC